jgi:uncharacterized protein YbjT (DUF2867 family)
MTASECANHTVLIVGITGMLGYQIASAILDKNAVTVRALTRSGNSNQAQLQNLKNHGVIFVEGDLLDCDSLMQACEGVDTIISVVKGGQAENSEESVVLTGQLNLLEAAKACGVKRFIPSDYSVDYFKLEVGDNYNLDLRKQFAQVVQRSGIGYTFVFNGVLTEILFSPFLNVVDFETGQFNYWGDGETRFDATTIADVARYTAEAALDPAMHNQVLKVAGDVLSFKQLHHYCETTSGKTLSENHLGSVEELQAWIAQAKQKATSHFEYLAQQYLYVMVSGKGKLQSLDNDRYPQIQPTNVTDFLKRRDHPT